MGNKTDAVLENQTISDGDFGRLATDCQQIRSGGINFQVAGAGSGIIDDPFLPGIISGFLFRRHGKPHGAHY